MIKLYHLNRYHITLVIVTIIFFINQKLFYEAEVQGPR